jgi:hypothetical protein
VLATNVREYEECYFPLDVRLLLHLKVDLNFHLGRQKARLAAVINREYLIPSGENGFCDSMQF